MTTRSRATIALLFAALALRAWGCSAKPWIHVFNNSQEPVVMRIDGKKLVARPAEQISFLYENDTLAVEIGSCPVLYRISFLPPEYMRTGWFRGHITFQIDPDRRAFVLNANDKPPISSVSYPQPEGYPLVPELTDACDG